MAGMEAHKLSAGYFLLLAYSLHLAINCHTASVAAPGDNWGFSTGVLNMSGMEAALASGLLKAAGNKIFALITNEFSSITSVKKDLSELKDTFELVISRLSAFQDREIGSDTSFPWVKKLKIFAYDVDDLLDEVRLEAEKQNKDCDGDKHAVADCFCAKPKSFIFQCKIAHKIKAIKARLDEIEKQTSKMNAILQNLPANTPVSGRRDVDAELYLLANVEESQIPKRDQDKDKIMSKLLEPNERTNVSIISIVGMGGSGKTTLAKHICHDENIIKHFNTAIFRVHVSREFHLDRLIGKLFEDITKEKSDNHSKPAMVSNISKELSNRMFLLVLDDAWHTNRHDWEQFMPHIKMGAPGSRVLLTTRNEEVADAVESWYTFRLECLSVPESWSFFLKISGWTEDAGSELLEVGKEVVNRCGGLPLAIRILGGVLRGKNEINTWRAIRGSSLWNEANREDQVFASLKLSYIHLENHLKQCFTFCSIFPKGYKINKDRLISQWIAHRYVGPRNEEQPEDIGSEYFDALVKVGFLQDALERGYNEQVYKMHDLIHDLITQKIAGHEVMTSLTVHPDPTHKCRYLSLNSTSCTEKIDRGLFDKVRALYTSDGNPTLDKLLKKSYHVRSVVLQYATSSPFPLFILKFQHLIYLQIHNFSCNKIPEAIAGCWNLQSLYFINCNGFVTLPESISELKKLRNLELQYCADLESLPQSIGGCRDLQCLQLYGCGKLREIPSSIDRLENLRVLNMVDIPSLQQIPTASGELSNLQIISFAGCSIFQELPSTFSCHRLHTLNLSGTKVTTIPEWVTSIDTLECIELGYCSELVELPRGIGNLKRLRVLWLERCNKLRCMPPGLQQLTRLSTLGLFVVGCSGDGARISELENLHMISGIMEVTNLKYVNDPSDAEKACLNRKNNIQWLELDWSVASMEEELVSGNQQDLDVLRALEPPSEVQTLEIRGYRGPYLPHWFGEESESSYREGKLLDKTCTSKFLCLTELRLAKLQNLEHLRGLLVLPSLKIFSLEGMPNLEELWSTTTGSEIGEEESGARYCFPVLSDLVIKQCPKLIVVPCFPPSLGYLWLEESNEQLLSAGSSSSCQLPLPANESPPSCSANVAVPHLKQLELWSMTGSSSGWELLQRFNGLEELLINDCTDLTELPEGIRSLTSVRKLTIWGCPALGGLPEWLGELRSLRELDVSNTPMITGLPQSTEHLTSLVALYIAGWENLKELPEVVQHLTSLQWLRLRECGALTVLPEWIGHLSALQTVWIDHCSALQSLPRSIKHLTALQLLLIWGCPGLAERYKEGVGSDRDLVSHIPDVRIWD
ncbi:hypothetical protein ACP4OV_015104 [Aristida adscensionis]